MDKIEEVEELVLDEARGLALYVRDNPLAMVAGAMILGFILARFAFLGNPKEAP